MKRRLLERAARNWPDGAPEPRIADFWIPLTTFGLLLGMAIPALGPILI